MCKRFLGVMLLALFFLTGCGHEEEARYYKIGILQYTDNNLEVLRGFKDGLKEYGYIEGNNISYINNGVSYSKDSLDGDAAHIIAENPDIILTSTTPATLAVMHQTRESQTPVIFAPVNDPVAAGLVKSILTPDTNVTGVRISPSDQKRVEWSAAMIKDLKNLLIYHDPKDLSSQKSIRDISEATDALGLKLTTVPVRSRSELHSKLSTIPAETDLILMPREGMIMSEIKIIMKAATERKIPVCTPRYEQIHDHGAAIGYGFIGYEVGKQAARIASTILHGTAPGVIPVETSEDYLFINTDVVKKLGLEIPSEIMNRAYVKNK